MILTDEELQGIAAQALNMAKRDIEQGRFNFLFASYFEGDTPPLHRMIKIEALIIEKLGRDWLQSGRTKDFGFQMLRLATDYLPPDAIVFVTSVNLFKPTEKLMLLSEDERLAVLDAGHDRHHQAVKEGLLTLTDALSALVQTPERICHYTQEVDPRGRVVGPPQFQAFPQDTFSGRLKMFGQERTRV